MTPADRNQRVEELLIDQAVFGLDAEQEAELAALRERMNDFPDNEFMHTAALVQLGMLHRAQREAGGDAARMPEALRARILDAAPRAGGSATVVNIDTHAPRTRAGQTRAFGLRDMGWAVAAVFALALVYVNGGKEVPLPTEQRAALVAESPDAIVVPWNTPEVPAYERVTGDIVWSDARQEGYMRFAGLPANNPAEAQYQLWIIDPERSAQPVDGGVFDVPAGSSEVIIPVHAKLKVDHPTTFAVTLEQPGGVVVSNGPLLIVAAAGS